MVCMCVRKIHIHGLSFRMLFARKRRVVTGGIRADLGPYWMVGYGRKRKPRKENPWVEFRFDKDGMDEAQEA